jgi:hypothetical protein
VPAGQNHHHAPLGVRHERHEQQHAKEAHQNSVTRFHQKPASRHYGDMDVLELVLPQAAAEFAKLPTVVRSVLRLCDGTRTLDEVCKISKLPQAREAVTRLQQLGLVAAKNGERKRRKNLSERTQQWLRNEDGFSNDEEAFFASSVEHLIEA